MNAIRRVVAAVGGTALVTLLAGFGMPGLSALVFLVTSALAMTCWILASPDRSDRICRMLLAGRGDPRCLTSGPGILPPEPAHPPSAPPRRRRSRARRLPTTEHLWRNTASVTASLDHNWTIFVRLRAEKC